MFKKSKPQEFDNKEVIQGLNLREGDYFYQTPLMIWKDDPITIYNADSEEMTFTPWFKSKFYRWIYYMGGGSYQGAVINSEHHQVWLKRTNWVMYNAKYDVYLDGEKIGVYRKQKPIKEKGFKKQLAYKLFIDEREFELSNPYLSTEIEITENEKVFFEAKRSFFDLGKNKVTQKRGEQHRIHMTEHATDYPPELWLALYAQAIMNLHIERSQSASSAGQGQVVNINQ